MALPTWVTFLVNLRGLPGVNAVENDSAVGTYLRTKGTQSRTALDDSVGDELKVQAGPVVDQVLSDSGRIDVAAGVAAARAVTPSLPGGRYADGTRHVPILVTSSLSPVTVNDVTAQHQRHPFRIAADARRGRIHIRNYNLFSETAQTGAINFTGVYFGPAVTTSAGNLTGAFSAVPTQLLGAFSTPANGGEYTSDWFDLPYTAYSEALISFGWTAAAGQVIHRSRALTWVTSTPADAAQPNTGTLSLTQTAYFDIVLEVEVSAAVPVVGYLGDSLTVGFSGGGANEPQILRDSWANQHALQHGHLAMLYAFSGAKLEHWLDTTQYKWTRWVGMTDPDTMVDALGSNDIFDSTAPADLATVQSRLQTVVVNSRTRTKQVYATTVLPRNGSDPAKEAVRVAYNDYLRGTPQFVLNTWDIAEALQDPADPSKLRAAFVGADGTHLTRGGNRRQATAVSAPLVRVAPSLPPLLIPSKPLLDTYPGARFAYSMRQLRSAYGGPCVRLRRSSDDAEADFGFVLFYLNRQAVLDWVGSGDAFVVTWYDQSGNGRHVTQAVKAAQPRLVTAGAFTTGSGKIAPRFDGTDDFLLTGTAWGMWAAGAASIMVVLAAAAGQINRGILSEGNSAQAQGQYTLQAGASSDATRATTNVQTQSGTALGTAFATGVFDGTVHHVGWIDTGSTNTVRRDETASSGVSYSRTGATLTPNQSAIGAIPRAAMSGFFAGDMFEAVGWPGAFDADTRKAIALDQRTFNGAP
jgi:hypothetical protein